MLEIVQEIVYQVTGRSGLTLDTDFVKDLALNSLDIMNIVCAFEDRFNVSIPTRDVWKMHQVRDVVRYMKKMGVAVDAV